MNRTRRYLPILLCALLAGPALAQPAPYIVRFVTDAEKEGGFLVEISSAALRRVGYTVEIRYMPWARALQMTMAGQAEALLGVYYTEARARELAYTDQIGSSELVFFKLRQTDISYASLDDLRPYRIGTVIGASYTTEFDNADYLRKEAASNYDVNLRKLMAGRLPLMLEKRAVVRHALASRYPKFAGDIEALDKPLGKASFFNAFSKHDPAYPQKVADFNRGLALLAKEGTLQQILAKDLHE